MIGAVRAPRDARARRTNTIDVASHADPMVIAHRGLQRSAPEDTLASFRAAMTAGVRSIKFDIRWSSDDVPVVIHDATVNRTATGATGNVVDYTAAQLMAMDVGTKYAPAFASEGVPTLYQVLRLIGGRATLHIEVKVAASGKTLTQTADMIAATVTAFGLRDSSVLVGFGTISGGIAWTTFGIPFMLNTASGVVSSDGSIQGKSAATHYAEGYRSLALDRTDPDRSTAAAAAAVWAGLGCKVVLYQILNRYQRADILATIPDAHCFSANDAAYIGELSNLEIGTAVPTDAPGIASGLIPIDHQANEIIRPATFALYSGYDTGRIGWPTYANVPSRALVAGNLGWGANGIGKFSFTVTFEASAADTSRNVGPAIMETDRGKADNATLGVGYSGILRANGDLGLYKTDSSGSIWLNIGTAAGADLSVGSSYSMSLEVTSTNVIFIANGQTINAADTTWRAELTTPVVMRTALAATFSAIKRES